MGPLPHKSSPWSLGLPDSTLLVFLLHFWLFFLTSWSQKHCCSQCSALALCSFYSALVAPGLCAVEITRPACQNSELPLPKPRDVDSGGLRWGHEPARAVVPEIALWDALTYCWIASFHLITLNDCHIANNISTSTPVLPSLDGSNCPLISGLKISQTPCPECSPSSFLHPCSSSCISSWETA